MDKLHQNQAIVLILILFKMISIRSSQQNCLLQFTLNLSTELIKGKSLTAEKFIARPSTRWVSMEPITLTAVPLLQLRLQYHSLVLRNADGHSINVCFLPNPCITTQSEPITNIQ